MRKYSFWIAIMILFAAGLKSGVLPIFSSQQLPERTTAEIGGMDPFQVTLYADANYRKPYSTWTLAPGRRMLRIPHVTPAPRSIAIGARVAVILFPNPEFSSSWRTLHSYTVGSEFDKVNQKYSLVPYTRFRGSTPSFHPLIARDDGCSLVIHRLDVDDLLGVYLTIENPFYPWGKFYPLPERVAETAVTFDRIPEGGPIELRFIASATGELSTYGTPNTDHMEITIRTPQMAELKLPRPNNHEIEYPLSELGVQEQISFMKLRYVGPIREQDYLGPTRVRAPGAQDIQAQMLEPIPAPVAPGSPGKGPVSLAGTWQSNVGAEYVFSQTGAEFSWTAASLGQQGSGTVAGMKVTTQMAGGGVFNGQVIEVDPAGAARRIDWENGVIIFRQGAAVAPAPPMAPLPAVADLAGDWQGFMNMTFSFSQSGNEFTWLVPATGEKAQGTIAGDALTVAWTNALGSGTAKGRIAAKDAAGRATRIEWDNGVVFSR